MAPCVRRVLTSTDPTRCACGYVARQMPGWAHLLESRWLNVTTMTAFEVRDDLKRYVDANDKLVTFDVAADSRATTFSSDVTGWMQMDVTVRRAA